MMKCTEKKHGIEEPSGKVPITLVVEDNEGLNRLLQKALLKEGFPSEGRLTGSDAVARITEEQNIILMLDYVLPDMTGRDVIKTLAEKEIQVPFIVVTAQGDERIAVEMMKMGARDYIIKDMSLVNVIPHVIKRIVSDLANEMQLSKTEEALQKSEERYRRITETITDYIYTAKLEAGTPSRTVHSEACYAVTGYHSEEFTSDPGLWINMVPEEDRGPVREQAEQICEGIPPLPLEHRIIRKDGVRRWVESSIIPGYDPDGSLAYYDCIIRDITERKRLEEQLLQSQKMEAVGQLAGGIAHDFNNILSAIVNYAYLTRKTLKGDGPGKDNIEHILSLSNRASRIIEGLLTFSRKNLINPGPVSLNDIVRGMNKLISRFIGEDILLEYRLAVNDPLIMADGPQVEQMIINLAANARDAMPGGGKLTIETGTVDIDGDFIRTHGFGRPGEYVLLSISDTGAGMDEETKEKIFEPFYTTKAVGKGTGLGLAAIYGIVKQHNGFITVDSEPGDGARFNMYLRSVPAEEEKKGVPDLMGHYETILVAEDEQAVRQSIKDILVEHNYRVIEAVDGNDAAKKFENNRHIIQLLILDVIMPRKNGKDAYDEINKMHPGIKAIFTSGYSGEALYRKGIFNDHFNYILKPISPDFFLKKIKEVLKKDGYTERKKQYIY